MSLKDSIALVIDLHAKCLTIAWGDSAGSVVKQVELMRKMLTAWLT